MCEMRQATYGMGNQLRSLLAYWWFFWLAYMLLLASRVCGQLSTDEDILTMLDKLSLVAGITGIVLNYMTAALVLSMTNAQNKRAAEWHR